MSETTDDDGRSFVVCVCEGLRSYASRQEAFDFVQAAFGNHREFASDAQAVPSDQRPEEVWEVVVVEQASDRTVAIHPFQRRQTESPKQETGIQPHDS